MSNPALSVASITRMARLIALGMATALMTLAGVVGIGTAGIVLAAPPATASVSPTLAPATTTTPTLLAGELPAPSPAASPNPSGAPAAGNAEATVREESWPGYNNGYDSQRYSALAQINTRNVASLRPVCTAHLGDDGPFETGPLVIGDVMYVTTTHTTVALDATDCSVRWRFLYRSEQADAWLVNRGAAYLDGRIFRGTSDGRFIALDAKTGALLWKTQLGDPEKGEAIPSAPIAWNGRVYVGMGIGDYGTRGRLLALDAATGKVAWQFNTIPMGKEAGADTWKRTGSAGKGGGGSWSSYTLDAARGEVLMPVANPSPMLDAHQRPGNNLFTNSVVAVDARTGALKWWYQLVPADWHDWDLGATAVIYTTPKGRDVAAMGSKDGNLYAIDRKTRKLIFKVPVTTVKNIGATFTAAGVETCPGVMGGVEWNGPAFDPVRNQLYVNAVDWCAKFKTGPTIMPNGQEAKTMGGSFEQTDPAQGWLTALDALSGEVRWRYHSESPMVAGVTPTAGGIVLTGDVAGNLLAMESATGKVLFKQSVGGSVAGGVITYSVGGHQYVAATAGNVSKITFASAMGSPTMAVFALDAPAAAVKHVEATSILTASNGDANAISGGGQGLYASSCAACHGTRGEGGAGPPLANIKSRMTLDTVIDQIKTPRGVMPKMYPAPLNDANVAAIANYVEQL